MASRREQIIQAIVTLLGNVLTIDVLRSPFDPVASGKDAVCIVDWLREETDCGTVPLMSHSMMVMVSVICRSFTAENNADTNLANAHYTLANNATINGLAIDTRMKGARVQREESDMQMVTITHLYQVDFRTMQDDLS